MNVSPAEKFTLQCEFFDRKIQTAPFRILDDLRFFEKYTATARLRAAPAFLARYFADGGCTVAFKLCAADDDVLATGAVDVGKCLWVSVVVVVVHGSQQLAME
jgi:hypothetical protein